MPYWSRRFRWLETGAPPLGSSAASRDGPSSLRKDVVAVGAAGEFACYFAAGFVAAPTAGLGGAAVAAECTAVGFTGGSGTEQLTGRGSPHRSHRPGGVGYRVHAIPHIKEGSNGNGSRLQYRWWRPSGVDRLGYRSRLLHHRRRGLTEEASAIGRGSSWPPGLRNVPTGRVRCPRRSACGGPGSSCRWSRGVGGTVRPVDRSVIGGTRPERTAGAGRAAPPGRRACLKHRGALPAPRRERPG